MKIIADQNIPLVKEAFSGIGDVTLVSGRDMNNALLRDCDILLVRSITRVDRNLLEGTKVKFVGTATIGTDHVDEKFLEDSGIRFSSAPGSNADSVAEYVVSSLVSLERKSGFSLPGKKIGIIGYGNVGSRVGKRAGILGMKCLVNDPPLEESGAGTGFVPLDVLLDEADVVTVHVPLVKSGKYPTFRMIDENFMKSLKKGAVLFNTSRGKVMSEDAILSHKDKLSALVLDVWENEPGISTETLDAADIATPHIAGYSYDGKVRGTGMLYRSLCGFLGVREEFAFAERIRPDPVPVIDICDSDNVIYDAVNAAYPVMRDDAALRKISGVPGPDRGRYFDRLRKEYPVRREFFNYTLKMGKSRNPIEASVLKELGFTIETV